MSIRRNGFRNSVGLVLAVGILLVATSEGVAQFRQANTNPAFKIPPPQQIPLLNNGSLQISPNPQPGLPNANAFSFIAGLPQDARLLNNGVQLWQPRIDAIPQAQNNNNNNNQQQTVTLTGPVAIPGLPLGVATLTGTIQGFNGRRNPSSTNPYDSLYASNPNTGFGGYLNGFGVQPGYASTFGSGSLDTYGTFGSNAGAVASADDDKADKDAKKADDKK
jgi:hypothetical protein